MILFTYRLYIFSVTYVCTCIYDCTTEYVQIQSNNDVKNSYCYNYDIIIIIVITLPFNLHTLVHIYISTYTSRIFLKMLQPLTTCYGIYVLSFSDYIIFIFSENDGCNLI